MKQTTGKILGFGAVAVACFLLAPLPQRMSDRELRKSTICTSIPMCESIVKGAEARREKARNTHDEKIHKANEGGPACGWDAARMQVAGQQEREHAVVLPIEMPDGAALRCATDMAFSIREAGSEHEETLGAIQREVAAAEYNIQLVKTHNLISGGFIFIGGVCAFLAFLAGFLYQNRNKPEPKLKQQGVSA